MEGGIVSPSVREMPRQGCETEGDRARCLGTVWGRRDPSLFISLNKY